MAQRTNNHGRWERIGRDALLDLLAERQVIPWFEAESRISSNGWKTFPKVQPLQLHAARRQLVQEGAIIEEITAHDIPVSTIRLPFAPNRLRELTRLRGARRKLYRRYLGWVNDQDLCGKHAEQIVLESLRAGASDSGLYVPPQTPGKIEHVQDIQVLPGPLDAYAHILELPQLGSDVTAVIEVKNINHWIYPWTRDLWEFLVKAANLSQQGVRLLPILVCMRSAYPTNQMAKDIGFFTCLTWNQLFSTAIPETDFDAVAAEFGLTIVRHAGPLAAIQAFLAKTLRDSPPPSPPDEDIEWFTRQADRFARMAPDIFRYQALGGDLNDQARRNAFAAFRTAAHATLPWPAVRGW